MGLLMITVIVVSIIFGIKHLPTGAKTFEPSRVLKEHLLSTIFKPCVFLGSLFLKTP